MIMQLTILPFLSAFVFNSVTASLNVDKQSGFDCGRVFFRRNVIKNAGSLVSRNMKRSSQISLIDGDSFGWGKPNHVGWPIRESGQIYGSSRLRESFYILVDSAGRVKDVMARLWNDDFTRCLRKNNSRKSPLLDKSNGYRCGQNFFGDEQLRGDVDEAISKLDQGLKYPSPYKGNLYAGHEYLTWPILNEKKDNSSHWEQSPFHVILNRDGKIIDVVAKLKCNDFIKCERATKSLRGRSTKASLLQRREVEAKFDYSCQSKVTYRHDYIDFVKLSVSTKSPSNGNQPVLYPMTYNQPPCQQTPCKIWPVLPNGRLYVNGNPAGDDFLLMSMQNKIQGVFSKTTTGMKPCQKTLSSNQPSTSKPNAGGPVGGNGLRSGFERNGRGEFIVRPGAQPPRYIPQANRREQ